MTHAAFGKDHELGKPATKKRVRKLARAAVAAAPKPSDAQLRQAAEERAADRWGEELSRITTGEKYKVRPFIHLPDLCDKGCRGAVDYFGHGDAIESQCWLARTVSSMVVRVHELVSIDPGLGPLYAVTMVKPTVWQFRAWCLGGPERDARESKPETWHEIAAVMRGPDLGERVK